MIRYNNSLNPNRKMTKFEASQFGSSLGLIRNFCLYCWDCEKMVYRMIILCIK